MKKIFSLLTLFYCISTFAQNPIDNYVDRFINYTEIGNSGDFLTNPVDLDFHSSTDRKYELWVLNRGLENTGGNTVIYFDAGKSTQSRKYVKDGNAWHFMSLSTALDFGENGNWGTSQGIKDANHSGGVFAGPTLWPSDLDIYGKVGNPPSSNYNGSHLDMIHQSPYGMGIAHEVDNVYWVWDGYWNNVARYDFADPHYPGGKDHSDGSIKRFTEVKVLRFNDLPSHMVLDKNTGWLYINDVGNSRVLRLNTKSGKFNSNLIPNYSEPLQSYEEYTQAEWEIYIDKGLERPVGIELYQNRLIISDNAANEIIIYDISGTEPVEKERLPVHPDFAESIMGVTVGPEGKIWFVDDKRSKVYRMDPAAAGFNEMRNKISMQLFPNPATDHVTVNFQQPVTGRVEIISLTGKIITSVPVQGESSATISSLDLRSGVYVVTVTSEQGVGTGKLVVE